MVSHDDQETRNHRILDRCRDGGSGPDMPSRMVQPMGLSDPWCCSCWLFVCGHVEESVKKRYIKVRYLGLFLYTCEAAFYMVAGAKGLVIPVDYALLAMFLLSVPMIVGGYMILEWGNYYVRIR